MQGTNALLVIVLGILIIYLAVSGRYKCLTNLIDCISGKTCSCNDTESNQVNKVLDTIKPLVPLQPLR